MLYQDLVSLQHSAQEAAKESKRLFTGLIRSIEKWRSEVKELIHAQEKAELYLVEGIIESLEEELVDLRKREAELDKLSHTNDHIHFLQVRWSSNQEAISDNNLFIRLPVSIASFHVCVGVYLSELPVSQCSAWTCGIIPV